MSHTVFFSWQSDTPTRVGRNFIERALQQAATRISEDTEIEPAARDLIVDRDTWGISGSPPIVETILQKIDKAAVVVLDLTFIGARSDGELAPNSNVLIEYGWALKSRGYERIVPVMNTAFGFPSAATLPFNLRHRRHPITYHCPPDTDEATRKQIREALAKDLENALRAVLANDDVVSNTIVPRFVGRSSEERPGRFRSPGQRLGVQDRIGSDVQLEEGAAIWLRVMPELRVDQGYLVSELKKAATTGNSQILSITTNWGSFSYLRAHDGFGVYAGPDADRTKALATAFCFTTGEVWSVDTFSLDHAEGDRVMWIPNVTSDLGSALASYASFLKKLGINGPLRWIAGMEGLRDRALPSKHMRYQLPSQRSSRRCLVDVVTTEGLYAIGGAPVEALGPFFATLFDACGAEWTGSWD